MTRFTRIVRPPLALAAALVALSALAQPPQPPADTPERRAQMAQQMAERFKAADKDGDGALSRAEAEAGMPRLAQRFDDIDTAKTGKITPEQIRSFMQKQMQERQDAKK
jgi:hypothetical protein